MFIWRFSLTWQSSTSLLAKEMSATPCHAHEAWNSAQLSFSRLQSPLLWLPRSILKQPTIKQCFYRGNIKSHCTIFVYNIKDLTARTASRLFEISLDFVLSPKSLLLPIEAFAARNAQQISYGQMSGNAGKSNFIRGMALVQLLRKDEWGKRCRINLCGTHFFTYRLT